MISSIDQLNNSIIAQKNPAENLKKASEKLQSMNVLIIQKLSIIVSGYFESIAKLQKYYQQIQTLVAYNKRVIHTLELFQQQEDKLIKRLRRMEQINIQYMREYCQVKGKQFKMPNIPQHKSIFSSVNLQEISQEMIKTDPPVIDINYKNQLMSILKSFYLLKQDKLLQKVQSQLKKQHNRLQIQNLNEIKQLIIQYNAQVQQKRDQKPFQFLKMLSQIRSKVETFYDAGNDDRQLKLQYKQQQVFVNKIINLHAKIQQMNQQAILLFLDDQKKSRSSVQKSRVQIHKQLSRMCQDLTQKNRQKKQQIHSLNEKYLRLLAEFEHDKKTTENIIDSLNKQRQIYRKQYDQKLAIMNENQKLYIDLIKKKQNEIQTNKQAYNKKIQELQNLSSQNTKIIKLKQTQIQEYKNKIKQQIKQLQKCQQKIKQLLKKPQKKLTLISFDILTLLQTSDQQLTRQLRQHIALLQAQLRSEKQKKNLLQQQIKIEVDKKQRLETQVKEQRKIRQQEMITLKQKLQNQLNIELISKQSMHLQYTNIFRTLQAQLQKQRSMNKQLNDHIAGLIDKIKIQQQQNCQRFMLFKQEIAKLSADRLIVENLAVKVCQVLQLVSVMEINKQIKNKLSDIRTNLQKFINQYQKNMQWNLMKQTPGYFRDYSMIREKQKDQSRNQFNQQQIFKKGYSLDMKNIPQVKIAIQNNHKQAPRHNRSFVMQRILQYSNIQNRNEQSLNLSKQVIMQQINNNDEYNNLRKLYQQAIQCLQMQEKKSKTMQLQYQRFTQLIMNKRNQDPEQYSLQKQLVYLTRLTLQQKQTIETQRREYNQIFKQYHQGFKQQMQQSLKSLRQNSFVEGKNQNKPFV